MNLKDYFKKHKRHYLFGVIFLLLTYVWYAIIPECFDFSLPTGGWDWLGFYGMLISVGFAVWGIREQIRISNQQANEQRKLDNEQMQSQVKENLELMRKQQQLSVIPCLDARLSYNPSAKNPCTSFRVFKDFQGKMFNDGYIIFLKPAEDPPSEFSKDNNIDISIDNKGLSTAFQILVSIYELKNVAGLDSLNDIPSKPIDNFYKKLKYDNFTYYEQPNTKPLCRKWIIAPQYNLCSNSGEFHLAFDFSKVSKTYHTILKFEFEDIYHNRYYQLMYMKFSGSSRAFLPISRVYEENKKEPL